MGGRGMPGRGRGRGPMPDQMMGPMMGGRGMPMGGPMGGRGPLPGRGGRGGPMIPGMMTEQPPPPQVGPWALESITTGKKIFIWDQCRQLSQGERCALAAGRALTIAL